ncbi:MAG: ice-binding family protein [Coriobacteriia bacterium]|nr:ice-binding family protein [Coriobacteriia bacterium]
MMVLALVAVPPATAMAAEPTVNLGTTADFAILAGTTITNTGSTTITGDVGLYPGSAFVDTGVTLIGARHIADATAIQAKTDLVTAYNDAAGRSVSSTAPVDLGGSILTPGVYSSGGVFSITGTLTLDAQGDPDAVFIFQSTATLITDSGSAVELINGARFCRVFWVVPSSATLGTDSAFVGHIFALTDIHAQTGATVEGQLLARNGEVTLQSNVITNEICAATRVININKTASPTSLPAGGGSVTYTYTVTNPGTVEFSNVTVTDDMVSPVTYVSGDTNGDEILQPGETWIYTATVRLTKTTTNVATVTGTGAGVVTTDTATTTVAAGGLLPNTATPWYSLLLAGVVLVLLGVAVRVANRIHG